MSIDRSEDAPTGLSAILNQLPEHELRDIARERGCLSPGKDRAQLAIELESLLSDHTSIVRSVVSMSPVLREALRAAFVAEDGAGVTPPGMALAMTAMRPATEPEVKPVEAAGFLSDLARLGLLLTWRDSLHQVPQYWLPWEVQHLVPPLVGWCPAEKDPPSPETRSRDTSQTLQLLATIWQHIAAARPRLDPPRPVSAERRLVAGLQGWPVDQSELERLRQTRGRKVDVALQLLAAPPAPCLLVSSALAELAAATGIGVEEADFFCHLLLELGLVESVSGRLIARQRDWERFAGRSVNSQLRALAHAFQSVSAWSELEGVLRQSPDLVLWHNGQYTCSYQHFRSQLVRMRHMLLRFLACSAETGWLRLDRIESALQRLWPQVNALLESPHASWGVAHPDPTRPISPHSIPPWDELEARVLRLMLQGPLSWMGLVELALEGERLVAFRPRGLADWVWDRPPADPASEGEAVTTAQMGEELTILVRPNAVGARVHELLGRFAVLQHAEPGRFAYRLDPRRIGAQFEQGLSASNLLAEWEGCLLAPAPSAVAVYLGELWSRFGRVRLYEGYALLELQDDVLLSELEASTSLSQRIVARISSRLALVEEEQLPQLLKEFSERGYMPRVQE